MSRQKEIRLWFAPKSDEETLVNWIMTDEFVLQYDARMQSGMFTKNKEWLKFFQCKFDELRNCSYELDKKEVTPIDAIGSNQDDCIVYTLESMPCLTMGLTKEILEQIFFKELENRDFIIQTVVDNYVSLADGKTRKIKNADIIFPKEGLIEFMETGIFARFSYPIYHPLTVEMRCEVLERAISIFEENIYKYHCLRENSLITIEDGYLELRLGDVNYLLISSHLSVGEECIKILDKDVLKDFEKFFLYLKDSAYVYSEKETLEYMKEVLKKYQSE